MALNPNIAMSFRAPQIESPINMMGQAAQLRDLETQNQMRQMQMAQAQQAQQRNNALLTLRQGLPGDMPLRDRSAAYRGAGFSQEADDTLKLDATLGKDAATAAKSTADAETKQVKLLRDLLPSVTPENFPTWQATAKSMLPQYAQMFDGQFSPQRVQQLMTTADQFLAQAAEAQKIQAVAPNSTLIRGGQVVGQAAPAPETATAAMREYEAARQQGFQGSFLDYQTRLRRAGASSTTIKLPPYQQEFAKKMGGKDAERVTEMLSNAASATARLVQIDRMGTALESGRFTPGIFGAQRQFLSQASEFLGLDASRLVDGQGRPLLGDAATADTIDAASKEIASEFAKNVGRVTNMSLGFIRDALPNLSRTPEGNAILIDVMRRAATRDQELGALADKYARIGDTRPPDMPSLFDAQADLERRDPVISPELRQRIEQGSRAAARPPAGQTLGGAATGRAAPRASGGWSVVR